MSGQIESDAQPLLPSLDIIAVKLVTLLHCAKSCVLPNSPRPLGVHGWVGSSSERKFAGDFIFDARRIIFRV